MARNQTIKLPEGVNLLSRRQLEDILPKGIVPTYCNWVHRIYWVFEDEILELGKGCTWTEALQNAGLVKPGRGW